MESGTELYDESLLSNRHIQSQSEMSKRKLKSQRKKIIIGLSVLFIIIFSTTIASACLIKESKHYADILKDVDTQIKDLETQLDDKITNKKVSFSSSDNLESILIASDTSNSPKKIAALDIADTKIKKFYNNKLPTLSTIRFPDSLQIIDYNLLGICSMQPTLVETTTIRNNTFSELKQLVLKDSPKIQMILSNSFPKMKSLSLINNSISIFTDNSMPQLQIMELYNNTKMTVLQIQAPLLSSLKMDKMNLSSIIIRRTNLTFVQNLENIKSISLSDSPISSFECSQSNSVFKITLQKLNLTKFQISSPTIKYIAIMNMPLLQTVRIGISSLNHTNQFSLKLLSTSIKSLSNENNYVNQIEIVKNPFLFQFSNNTMPRLLTLSMASNLQVIQNNHMESLTQIKIFQLMTLKTFKGNITKFNGNHCPTLLSIDFSFQNIQQFKYNVLVSIVSLKISDNKLNDSIAIDILTKNIWSRQYIKKVDLSNNNIVNVTKVKAMYQKEFPNAQILI